MNPESIYNNSVNDWLISIGIILGAFLLNKIIILLNRHVIRKITAKTNSKLDDILFQMLQAPVLFGIILVAIWVAAERLVFSEQILDIIDKAYKILIVVNITWFASRLTRALIEEFLLKKPDDDENSKKLDLHVVLLIRKTFTFIIWVIGIVFALHNAGYQVSALLGTLGIGGLAFAFAAQDTLKNIFGGFTVFADKPFKIGDRIIVDGKDGIVEDIGIRSTRIRTLERKLVVIPNSKISDA